MKKWSLSFRVWHWVHAFVVLGLLGTVFLRKTFLSWRTNSEILTAKLSAMQIDVTAEQAKILAKAVRDPMWEWHIILGYALAFLLIVRVVLFFTQSGRQSYLDIKTATLHKKMVKVSYLGIYAVLLFMALSGLSLHFHEVLGLLKPTVETIKELHEFIYNFVWIFALMHIVGVLIAENRDQKGIVSDMLGGGEVK